MAENEKKVVKAEEKSQKPEKKEKKKEKKEFWRGFKSESRKIVWPTWKQVLKNTGIILVICIMVAIVVCAIDIGLGALINLMV